MRIMTFSMMSAALALGMAGPAGAMSPASGTIELRATATFSDGTSADRLYQVRLDADSDGDGIGDEAWLRVRCADGAVAAAFEYDVKAPRDVAAGQASGKRQHKPFTIIKEWDAKTGAGGAGGGGVVGSMVSWDLATGKGARAAVAPPYNIKENKGLRGDHSGASDASAGKGSAGADRKTMAHDSWHEVAIGAGSPNLCAHGAEDR